MIKLTDDQKKVVNGVLDIVRKPFNEKKFIIGITGFPGVGKTVACNWIVNSSVLPLSMIRCCAPTHKACRVLSEALGRVECFTIQSVFGLRLNMELKDFDPKNPQFEPKARPKLDNIRLLLIDEASMIPADLIRFIVVKCKEQKIYLLFVGDSNQLPPVGEKSALAFNICPTLFRLNRIIRQAGGNPITKLCGLLRKDIDLKTHDFIRYVTGHVGKMNYDENGNGFSICPMGDFKRLVKSSFSIDEYKKNIDMCRVIAYTNKRVIAWNRYIRNIIVPNADRSILTKDDLIMSNDTIVNEFLEIVINNSEEYIVYDIADYRDSVFRLKGFLVRFQMIHGGKITRPMFVLDHTDKTSVVKYMSILDKMLNSAKHAQGSSRVAKWKNFFQFKRQCLLATDIYKSDTVGLPFATRTIDYGYAITSHKAQGSTYNKVFVDMTDIVFDSNGSIYHNYDEMLRRLYVACSRARNELCIGYRND